MTFRNALALIAIGVAGCAPPASRTADGSMEDGPAASGFRGLGSDAVLVLPVRAGGDTAAIRSAGPDTLAVALEAALRDSLSPVVARGWVWPDQLRQLHRRNPLSVPDPARLRIAPASVMRAGVTLPQDVQTDIRRLLSISGARRHVLATFLGIGRPASGSSAAAPIAMLVLIDARRGEVTDVTTIAGTRGSARDVSARLAGAVRALLGPG